MPRGQFITFICSCGAFRGQIVLDENFIIFCLKHPRNRFSEWRVSRLYFLRNHPITYFWDQTDYVTRSRQNCCRRKLQSFLLKTSPKSFFQKTRFLFDFFCKTTPSPIFWGKRTIWCISRQNCYIYIYIYIYNC